MNDIAALTGPGTQGMVIENVQSTVDLAKANGIRVVLASLLPICDCGTNQTAARPRGKILGLNDWIEEYAEKTGSVYLNYYKALADGRNFKAEWTKDGLLPNDAGYRAMAPVTEAAIAKALAENP
jgi:lysophospholipase L1-like esterase